MWKPRKQDTGIGSDSVHRNYFPGDFIVRNHIRERAALKKAFRCLGFDYGDGAGGTVDVGSRVGIGLRGNSIPEGDHSSELGDCVGSGVADGSN